MFYIRKGDNKNTHASHRDTGLLSYFAKRNLGKDNPEMKLVAFKGGVKTGEEC